MIERQQVKICGISDPETARFAVDAGADYIGLVFFSGSHRHVEIERATEVANAARMASVDGAVNVVGLFVNEPLDFVVKVRDTVGLDVVQLSGDESSEYMAALAKQDVRFMGTVRAGSGNESEATSRFREIVARKPHAIHFDTHVPGMWGGSGVVGDWDLARALAAEYPLFLAGGLDPTNVSDAVRIVAPSVVDVSSGVETNKQKDHTKIRAFIAAARGAEGEEQ